MSGFPAVALVTGSSRGIGRAIALGCAERGADVAVNYRSAAGEAEDVARRIREMGRRAVTIQSDVTTPGAAAALIDGAEERLGPLELLVNNVGEFFFKPLAETTPDEWRRVLDSNVSSVHALCRAFIARRRPRRGGVIVNIGLGPTYLVRGAANVAAYAIAKTGVSILTRSLAIEEARHGIRVNCVAPGLIDNGMLPQAQREWMERRVPMGRLGHADEIARAVAFLASDEASYVSGSTLAVDGAWDWQDRPTTHDDHVSELFLEDAAGVSSGSGQ